MVARRWGILWRRLEVRAGPPPLRALRPALLHPCTPADHRLKALLASVSWQVPLRHVPLIIFTVFYLHNLAMDYNVPRVESVSGSHRFSELIRSSDIIGEPGRRRDRECSALRDKLVALLEGRGMCRPQMPYVRRSSGGAA